MKEPAKHEVLRHFSEFGVQLQSRIGPQEAADMLRISPSLITKTAQKLDISPIVKGTRTRWSFSHFEVRMMHVYLTALKLNFSEKDAVNISKALSKKVQELYQTSFVKSIVYKIEVVPRKKLTGTQEREKNGKQKEAESVLRMLKKFNVMIGVGGEISIYSLFLRGEIENGLVAFQIIPLAEKVEDDFTKILKELDEKLESANTN